MAVFREITVPFGGRDYVVTPSNKVLRRIEMAGRRADPQFNLIAVCVRASQMAGGFFDLAFVLSELINSAGGNVTEDDALAEFVGIKGGTDLGAYIALITSCIMPELSDAAPKKADGAETIAT